MSDRGSQCLIEAAGVWWGRQVSDADSHQLDGVAVSDGGSQCLKREADV